VLAQEDIPTKVFNYLRKMSPSSLMLTGGRSAAHIYRSWADSPECIEHILSMECYFSDERCVSPDSPDSNFFLAMSSLFPGGIPNHFLVHRMEGERIDADIAAHNYSKLLLKPIDLLILSIGDDGHIASLFPYSSALNETQRLVMPVIAPKSPFHRLTITPKVIQNAREVIVIAEGDAKKEIYMRALRDPGDFDAIPARMVLDRTWVFD
jgi:6-phosphogluconolactonase